MMNDTIPLKAAEERSGVDPNKRIRELKAITRLGLALRENGIWRRSLENLPQVLSGSLTVGPSTLEKIGRDPIEVVNYLVTKDVKVGELMASFERIQYEHGCYLLGKPETDLVITMPLRRELGLVRNGHRFELYCLAEGFPSPSYEYFKDGVKISDGPRFVKTSARFSDSGVYECKIIQRRFKGAQKQLSQFCSVKVERDEENERLSISVGPAAISLNIGHPRTNLRASVNEDDLTQIRFQWFKFNQITNADEAITDNPSALTDELIIDDFQEKDAGRYKCQAVRESTNETVMSTDCAQLYAIYPSEIDLKIALIMGTGNYHENGCPICSAWLGNIIHKLHVHDNISRLKDKLERMGYLVMAFGDLDADSYLRFIRLFQKICEEAENVSVFIYVAGHGHNQKNQDFLIPSNIRSIYHASNHEYGPAYSQLRSCSLENLLDNFRSTEHTKYTVTCFWDLCRTKWVDLKTVEAINNDNLNFNIIFSCNVGKSAYEIIHDMPELNLKRGSILLNVFLNKLRSNESFFSIVSDMNEEIVSLKNKNNVVFSDVTGLRLHSTMPRTDLTSKASNNSYFARIIDSLYLSNSDMRKDYIVHNGKKIGEYKYTPDTFINCMRLEIVIFDDEIRVDVESMLDGGIYGEDPLAIERIQEGLLEKDVYFTVFRMKSVLSEDAMKNLQRLPSHHIKLKLYNVRANSRLYQQLSVNLPTHVHKLYERLHSEDINQYVEDKKQVDYLNDNISISSVSDVDINDVDTDSEIGDH